MGKFKIFFTLDIVVIDKITPMKDVRIANKIKFSKNKELIEIMQAIDRILKKIKY